MAHKVLFCGNINYDSLGTKSFEPSHIIAAPVVVPLPDTIDQVFSGSQGTSCLFRLLNADSEEWCALLIVRIDLFCSTFAFVLHLM